MCIHAESFNFLSFLSNTFARVIKIKALEFTWLTLTFPIIWAESNLLVEVPACIIKLGEASVKAGTKEKPPELNSILPYWE